MAKARWNVRSDMADTEIPATTKVVMIASGKGGVGKSSVTANLAAALAPKGFTVGVLDADIWGFSIPRMLGVDGRLQGQAGSSADDKKMVPHDPPVWRRHPEGRVDGLPRRRRGDRARCGAASC